MHHKDTSESHSLDLLLITKSFILSPPYLTYNYHRPPISPPPPPHRNLTRSELLFITTLRLHPSTIFSTFRHFGIWKLGASRPSIHSSSLARPCTLPFTTTSICTRTSVHHRYLQSKGQSQGKRNQKSTCSSVYGLPKPSAAKQSSSCAPSHQQGKRTSHRATQQGPEGPEGPICRSGPRLRSNPAGIPRNRHRHRYLQFQLQH